LLFYFTSYVLNMFRILIYPSSVTCDYSVELPHWSYGAWFDVCWSFGVVGLEWYPCCRLKVSVLQDEAEASACNTDTTPTQPHRNSNTHLTKNNTKNAVIQQNSRKLLMILQPATQIPLQHNHTETPTHIEPRTIRPMW